MPVDVLLKASKAGVCVYVCGQLSTYFNLSVSSRSKQPGLCTVQGYGGDPCVAVAAVELLDLLTRVCQPADHRGGRVTADYLHRQRRSEPAVSIITFLIYFMAGERPSLFFNDSRSKPISFILALNRGWRKYETNAAVKWEQKQGGKKSGVVQFL